MDDAPSRRPLPLPALSGAKACWWQHTHLVGDCSLCMQQLAPVCKPLPVCKQLLLSGRALKQLGPAGHSPSWPTLAQLSPSCSRQRDCGGVCDSQAHPRSN